MEQDPDVGLMLAFQGGDEAAFEELVRRHQRRVLNLVYKYLGDAAAAEDAAQDVFVKVYRAKSSYRPAARFTTWLHRIAVNHCLNALRGRKEKSALPEEEALGAGDAAAPDEGLRSAELRAAVREAVEALPENQRMAVILSRFEEQPYERIAEAMDLSLEAVKSLLFRARENLKQRLQSFVKPE